MFHTILTLDMDFRHLLMLIQNALICLLFLCLLVCYIHFLVLVYMCILYSLVQLHFLVQSRLCTQFLPFLLIVDVMLKLIICFLNHLLLPLFCCCVLLLIVGLSLCYLRVRMFLLCSLDLLIRNILHILVLNLL